MKRAVLQWAGQEQAGSVQLMPFLEANCRTWTKLEAAAGAGGAVDDDRGEVKTGRSICNGPLETHLSSALFQPCFHVKPSYT